MTTPLADVHSAAPLLVLSHLRWGEHWQRSQQLFARLARSREVLFVEPPRLLDDIARPQVEHAVPYPGVHRVVARLPVAYRAMESVAHITVRTLLIDLLGPYGALAHRFDAPILWLSTPLPAPAMVGAFDERLIVYDPMPPAVARTIESTRFRQCEALLLRHANLVFADRETGVAPGRRSPSPQPSTGGSTDGVPHRTEHAWDTLAADIDRLLRDVCANRRAIWPADGSAAVPGWLAARNASALQR